jgi:hypothetical protein
MPKMQGGCLCGAVRYSADAEPGFVGVCHCRDCQKHTGSAFAFLIGVSQTALKVQGALRTFASPGDTGKPVVRQFCPECGSSIAADASTLPGMLIINGGTLDDPVSIAPTTEVYCERGLPWVQLGGMQRFAKSLV